VCKRKYFGLEGGSERGHILVYSTLLHATSAGPVLFARTTPSTIPNLSLRDVVEHHP
jgi:hypothetical protein